MDKNNTLNWGPSSRTQSGTTMADEGSEYEDEEYSYEYEDEEEEAPEDLPADKVSFWLFLFWVFRQLKLITKFSL